MNISVESTPIDGLKIFTPNKIGDERGYFLESMRKEWLEKNGIFVEFVQENHSLSQKNVLRGLHFQVPPFGQAKIVTVFNGSVLDVALDLRKSSPTFGKHFSIELKATHPQWFYIPEGFAHGFLTLEENTLFYYKCSNYYSQKDEMGIQWDDSMLEIDWRIQHPILSKKDENNLSFESFKSPF